MKKKMTGDNSFYTYATDTYGSAGHVRRKGEVVRRMKPSTVRSFLRLTFGNHITAAK